MFCTKYIVYVAVNRTPHVRDHPVLYKQATNSTISSTGSGGDDDTKDNTALWVVIGIAAALLCAAQVALVCFHYRNKEIFRSTTKALAVSENGVLMFYALTLFVSLFSVSSFLHKTSTPNTINTENLKETDAGTPAPPPKRRHDHPMLPTNVSAEFEAVYDRDSAEPTKQKGDDESVGLLDTIQSRRSPGADRVKAMRAIMDNLGDEESFDALFEPENARKLLSGFCTQIGETYNAIHPVTATSIEFMPDIWWRVMGREPDVAIEAVGECLDTLFKIYDDVNRFKEDEAARSAISRIVGHVVRQNDPKCVNAMVSSLADKVDVETDSHPEVRWFAMEQIEKLMFPSDSMLVRKTSHANVSTTTKYMDRAAARRSYGRRGTTNRTWFDVAAGNQEAPVNGTKEHGDNHRRDVLKAVNTMLMDPNPDSREIALTLVDLFIKRNTDYLELLNAKGQEAYLEWRTGSPEPDAAGHDANYSMTVSMTISDGGGDEQ